MDYDTAVASLAERGRENLQEQTAENVVTPQIGVEVEYPHAAETLHSMPANYVMATLDNLAERDDVAVQTDALSPYEQIVGARFTDDAAFSHDSAVSPEFDYDFGPEGEIGTEITRSLEEAYQQVDAIEGAVSDAVASGKLYRQGLLPGLIRDDFDDPINWDIGADDETLRIYETPKTRYRGLEQWYTVKNMGLGGTGSIQVTSTPRMEDVETDLVQFLGGGEKPGIPALSPFFFAPFVDSPVIEDGKLRWQYGREIAYQMGRVNSPIISADDGFGKFGYYPEWEDIDGLEDVVRVNAEKPYEFTMPVPAHEVAVDGDPLHERDGFPHIDNTTLVRVTAATPTDDGYTATTLQEIIAEQRVDGMVSLQDMGGDWNDIPATLDYTAMDDDQFLEAIVPQLYDAVEGTNTPNWRPKLGMGVIESRDFCNNPYLEETVAMQAAVFQNWEKLQEIAMEYGITEDDAEELRIGVARDGVRYQIDDGIQVRDVLDSMQDVLYDGVLAASDTEQPADDLNSYLEKVIQTGVTPAEDLYYAYLSGDFTTAYKHAAIGPDIMEEVA
jgi:hypothetical protein